MIFTNIHSVYCIGIGGIGVSALARYFLNKGKKVAGYDRNPSTLTAQLIAEGADIHFKDDIALMPEYIRDLQNKDNILVIYTTAVPDDHSELQYFRRHGYVVHKRSVVLGMITESLHTIAIAGTHGKTTITSLTAHIHKQSGLPVNAFIGGIAKNYETNLLLDKDSNIIIVEADEYDRSFLRLTPDAAVITSIDADHLDVYGSKDEIIKSFDAFVRQIKNDGVLVYKKNLPILIPEGIRAYSYSVDDTHADFYAADCIRKGMFYEFTFRGQGIKIEHVQTAVPGMVNVENTIAAMALSVLRGLPHKKICEAVASFFGVQRRFDICYNHANVLYIDDYAHHPEAIAAVLRSLKHIFPERKITAVFQPHLYTRTRDMAHDFAVSLAMADDLILLDIYPARENPIPGVTSRMIAEKVKSKGKVTLCSKKELPTILQQESFDILVSMGAGDIDTMVPAVTNLLKEKYGT